MLVEATMMMYAKRHASRLLLYNLLITRTDSLAVRTCYRKSGTRVCARAYTSTATPMAATASGDDGSRWRIWTAIEELEANGLSNSKATVSGANVDDVSKKNDDVTDQVVQILQHWGEKWAGQSGWNTLLNKKSLLHEIEESIVALRFLDDWLERREGDATPVTLVDVCCGKGILSMLASYLFLGRTSTHVSGIIMLDKQEDINWAHIIASNDSADEEGRPVIEAWGGCNLHDIDSVVERLSKDEDRGSLALVGIHLCKQLSPSCAGVVNTLGPEKCPFLCLAPCCLPRVARNLSKANNSGMMPNRMAAKSKKEGSFVVPVRQFEAIEDREFREEANQKRSLASKRTFRDVPCYLCSEIHPIHKCGLLPSDENERLEIFEKAAARNPCWKCGEVGHFRKDCPSDQQASRPPLMLPPTVDLDVSPLLVRSDANDTKPPFEVYCHLLSTAIQRENVGVYDVGLVNTAAHNDNAANLNNWNRDRKSIYIVASQM